MLFAFDLKPLNSYQILTLASNNTITYGRHRHVYVLIAFCFLCFFFVAFIFSSVFHSIILILDLFCLLWICSYNCIVVVNRQRHKLILCDENGSVGERASLGNGGDATAAVADVAVVAAGGGRYSTWNWKLHKLPHEGWILAAEYVCAINMRWMENETQFTIHNWELRNRSGC